MAPKSIFFLLAFVLVFTRMGSSVEEVDNVETENHHHHHHHAKPPVHAQAKAPAHAPFHAPVKAPAHAPFHAPAKAPAHAPFHAPAKSPVYSPPKAPTNAPHPYGCVAMCASYCKPISPKRPCMKTCTACCAKCKCVPGFAKCSSWDKVAIHGYFVKCP